MSFSEIIGFDEIVGDDDGYGDEYAGGLVAGLIGDDDDDAAALAAMSGADGINAGALAKFAQQMKLARAMRTLKNPLNPASLARNFHPRVIDVQSKAARAPRKLAVNFFSQNVAAGAVQDISVQPQLPFRGERLMVPSDIAGSFDIVDVIVGNRSQFAAAGRMAARVASELSFGATIHLDTASVAMSIILRVENVSGQDSRFNATLFGTTAIP